MDDDIKVLFGSMGKSMFSLFMGGAAGGAAGGRAAGRAGPLSLSLTPRRPGSGGAAAEHEQRRGESALFSRRAGPHASRAAPPAP